MLTNKISVEVFQRNFSTIEYSEYLKLRELTIQNTNSGMNCALTDYYYKRIFHRSDAFIAKNTLSEEWVGWCLAEEQSDTNNTYMIFVKEQFRCQGIGQNLIVTATGSFGKRPNSINECFPWNGDSTLFFNKVVSNSKINLFDHYSKEKISF